MNPSGTRCRVALMAKAPVPGAAKTRLVPALGAAGAAALAERLLHHALRHALDAALGPVVLWTTPDASHPAFVRAAQRGVHLAVQGSGDLGARMAQVFQTPPPGEHDQDGDGRAASGDCAQDDDPTPILLMGTDAPGLTAFRLQEAAQALRQHPVVFAPAHDGGYALVGLQRPEPALLTALFSGMVWSTPQVMADTRQRLRALGCRHLELSPVHDIDEPADLVHLQRLTLMPLMPLTMASSPLPQTPA